MQKSEAANPPVIGPGPALQSDAFDLLARMLDPNPITRISAREALRHPFLAEAGPEARKRKSEEKAELPCPTKVKWLRRFYGRAKFTVPRMWR